jgi:hypothetical protein
MSRTNEQSMYSLMSMKNPLAGNAGQDNDLSIATVMDLTKPQFDQLRHYQCLTRLRAHCHVRF